MAIVYRGTVNSIKQSQIPQGYFRPIVSTFNDGTYQTINLVENILKSVVTPGEQTNLATMEAIITELTTVLTAKVQADYIATNAVEAYGILRTLTTNVTPDGGDDPWLSADPVSYICGVTLYVKIT